MSRVLALLTATGVATAGGVTAVALGASSPPPALVCDVSVIGENIYQITWEPPPDPVKRFVVRDETGKATRISGKGVGSAMGVLRSGGPDSSFTVRAGNGAGAGPACIADPTPDPGPDPSPGPDPTPRGAVFPGHVPGKVILGMSCGSECAAKESELGHAYGVHRIFDDFSDAAGVGADAAAEHAANRLPWISLSTNGLADWKAIASGAQDAQIKAIAAALPKDKPVALTLHHEPSNDAAEADGHYFAEAFTRFATVLKGEAGTSNVAVGPVLGDWLFNPVNKNQDPKNWTSKAMLAASDFFGVDVYENGSGRTLGSRLTDIDTWLAGQGFPGLLLAVGETGGTNAAYPKMSGAQWIDSAMTWATANTDKVAMVSYFNSTANSRAGVVWPLNEAPDKLAAFQKWLADPKVATALADTTTPPTTAPDPTPTVEPDPTPTKPPTPDPGPDPNPEPDPGNGGVSPNGVYPAGSYWNTPLGNAPTDPLSAKWVDDGRTKAKKPYLSLGLSENWSQPVFRSTCNDPEYTITAQRYPKGLTFKVHIPQGAATAAGADAQMTVLDFCNRLDVDLHHASFNGGQWVTDDASRYFMDSSGLEESVEGGHPGNKGHRGIPASLRGFQYAEVAAAVKAGRETVGHMVTVSWWATGENPCPIWPMPGCEHGKGGTVPEGVVLRISPSVDLSTLGLNPYQLVIARTLQVHGGIVSDNAGSSNTVKLSADFAEWEAAGVSNTTFAKLPLTPDKWEFVKAGFDPRSGTTH